MSQPELHTLHEKITQLIQNIEINLQHDTPINTDPLVEAVSEFQQSSKHILQTSANEAAKQNVFDILHKLNVLTNNISAEFNKTKESILKLKQEEKLKKTYSKGMK